MSSNTKQKIWILFHHWLLISHKILQVNWNFLLINVNSLYATVQVFISISFLLIHTKTKFIILGLVWYNVADWVKKNGANDFAQFLTFMKESSDPLISGLYSDGK